MTTLDMDSLERAYLWNQGSEHQINLAAIVLQLQPAIEEMMKHGLLTKKDSFGFAMASPLLVDRKYDWDDPEKLVYFVQYWGPDGPRYAANAVRKLRAAARTGHDTQHLYLDQPELFRDKVESQEPDGSFAWGDFPYGGAAHVARAHYPATQLLGAVSALSMEEDHVMASFILGVIDLAILKSDQALIDARNPWPANR